MRFRYAETGEGDPMTGGRLGTIGFGVIMIVAAIGFMIWDASAVSDARAWPTVTGRVLESSYSRGSSRAVTYRPHVLYEYRVGGRTWRNTSIWLTAMETFGEPAEAEAFLRPWPVGGAAEIHYNPANPQQSALLVENEGGPMIFLILIGLLIVAGGWYWPRMRAWADRKNAAAAAIE